MASSKPLKERYTMPAWIIEKKSSLSIEGSSNINKFFCSVKEHLNTDTLYYIVDEKKMRLEFSDRNIVIDINRFDCQYKIFTADFRKTLKASKFPFLKIHFISLDDPFVMKEGNKLKGVVEIELAGVLKYVDLEYSFQKQNDKIIQLTGSMPMRFFDFRLEPPKKMAGLIKINEDIKVNFKIFFRQLD